MYAGEIIESAPTERIFHAPQHPYTWGLLRSLPRLDRPRDEPLVPIPGRPPSLITPPSGCRFYPRCFYDPDDAREQHPELEPVLGEDNHAVRCFLAAETRKRIWAELAEGRSPDEIKRGLTVQTGAG